VNKLVQRYRYPYILLKQLVKTDFKLRYQGSFLGYIWSLLKPLAIFLILYIVFVKFLKIGDAVPHFGVYLLLGIVLWNYFVEVTVGGVGSIVNKGDLIRKINFPKYIIILAGSFSALINLFLNFIVIAFFMYLSKVDITSEVLWAPLLIFELFVFSLSIAFFLSAAFVRFRDITYIWEVAIQGAFYATPILYPLSLIPISAAKILILNPMTQIIQDMRYVLISDQTITIDQLYSSHWARLIPVGIVIISAVIASVYFRKQSKYFAEYV
jgi:ABC-2 type transport system permease protein